MHFDNFRKFLKSACTYKHLGSRFYLMNTLTLETRALKVACHRWKELPHEVQRMINLRTLFVSPTAPLIKGLEFNYWPTVGAIGIYEPAKLRVACDLFLVNRFNSLMTRPTPYRHYTLSDFGDSEYDRYQIDSDRRSGISLGRVAGAERRGM